MTKTEVETQFWALVDRWKSLKAQKVSATTSNAETQLNSLAQEVANFAFRVRHQFGENVEIFQTGPREFFEDVFSRLKGRKNQQEADLVAALQKEVERLKREKEAAEARLKANDSLK
jgi:hypothetical protein